MASLDNAHEASASATGYLFQCRYALWEGLRAIPDSPELLLSIEKLDDVAFETGGEPTALIQTKHHLKKRGNLTDASADLWKTLRIWAARVVEDPDLPFRVKFVLLTTGIAPENSAASFLRVQDRNEKEADRQLVTTCATSSNKDNAQGYAAYRALSEESRLSLLRAINVLDSSSNIVDLRDDIIRELYHAAGREHVEHLVERLEGWWFNVVVGALSGGGPSEIPVLAIDQRVDELREEFRRSALPVDFGSTNPSPEVVAELDKRPFVRQLRRIELGRSRVEYAIRDYYRASEQRSRWAREDLLLNGEIEDYERELIEAWEPRYATMLDKLDLASGPDAKVTLGQALFLWAEQEASFPLRSVRDRFLSHGSFHILSNRYAVGWHPDFKVDAEPSAEGEG